MRPRPAALALTLALAALPIAGGAVLHGQQPPSSGLLGVPPIEHYLEALRQQAGIPGLSAAVVRDGELVWERGFGFQNVEARVRATPDTPYLVGGLTQSLAAVLLLQCVEYGRLELDQPVRRYGVELPEPAATLRQVLSHSSTGTPGAAFQFAPDRFARLSTAVEWCAPQPYRKSVAHRVLERLAMRDSVPGLDLQDADVVPEGLFDPAALARYRDVLARLAVPYKSEGRNRVSRGELPSPEGINAAHGLVTTARDLAQFERALDSASFLLDETRQAAWTPMTATDGKALPTGLGWFVQRYRDEPVVWQYGLLPNAYSSMIIRLPQRRVSLILLANSDGLAAPFDLAAGDVTKSLFATLFLRLFAS